MSLRRIVVDMITERGCGTVDHLMPRLASLGFTRDQAIKALHNAKNLGYLWCEGHPPRRGLRNTEARPATYWPGKKKADPMYSQLIPVKQERPRVLVSSVFELGAPRPEEAWPPGWMGTVYRPLGGWHSEEQEVTA
jgi:Fe2+ transport system protein FeoA